MERHKKPDSSRQAQNRADLLEKIGVFVLDMDGTFYLGSHVIEGAIDFVRYVEQKGRRVLFFTNNSSQSPEVYMDRLSHMGCPITRDQIMTSGDVTIAYLKENYDGKRIYLVGTEALRKSFQEEEICLWKEGEPVPDIVVVGFDTALTYEKLCRACGFIRSGALFLATHLDLNCPTEDGFIPDCGALCAAITASTGVKPRYLGKPFRETVDMVLMRTGEKRDRVAFVGDRLYTDVATGVNHGAWGVLVMTGETKAEDLEKSQVKPDAVFASLGEMKTVLEGCC